MTGTGLGLKRLSPFLSNIRNAMSFRLFLDETTPPLTYDPIASTGNKRFFQDRRTLKPYSIWLDQMTHDPYWITQVREHYQRDGYGVDDARSEPKLFCYNMPEVLSLMKAKHDTANKIIETSEMLVSSFIRSLACWSTDFVIFSGYLYRNRFLSPDHMWSQDPPITFQQHFINCPVLALVDLPIYDEDDELSRLLNRWLQLRAKIGSHHKATLVTGPTVTYPALSAEAPTTFSSVQQALNKVDTREWLMGVVENDQRFKA